MSGTPITGRSVCAATTPGSAAARPAPAMITFSPRMRAFFAYSATDVRVAVRAHHAHLVADPALLELLRRLLHQRHVALRAHDDAHLRRVVHVELVELVLDLGLGDGSADGRELLGSAHAPTLSTARARCRVRSCRPSNSIRSARRVGAVARLARRRAEPGHAQHAPAGGHDLAVALGRAGVEDLRVLRPRPGPRSRRRSRTTPGSRPTRARRSPPSRSSTPARRPRARPARPSASSRSSRSERSRGSTACVSGSPKRALYSSTFALPSAPIIRPA